MKDNIYYKYLLSNIDRIAKFQDGITTEERLDKKLIKNVIFSLLFTTINNLAFVATQEDKFPEKVTKACEVLTYTDIYKITELIIKRPEILIYNN